MSRLDRRLLAGGAARRGLLTVAACGVVQSLAVIAGAALLASMISAVFEQHASFNALELPLFLLAIVQCARALLIWLGEGLGHRTAATVIAQVRSSELRRLSRRGPVALSGERSGELATLLTTGLDALDPYFARFLPQVIVAAAVPLLAVVYVATVDWVSALILIVTVPLIPIFMVIIGRMADRSARQRWQTFQLLGGHFLDVLQGLPTLRLFGRGLAQVEHIRQASLRLRRATMATLRLAFLSSLALELLASLGTALLAVTIAVRLVGGGIDLRSGLTVLILAPEVYLPLRALGTAFHGSFDGVEATRRLAALSAPVADSTVSAPVPRAAHPRIEFARVTFAHQGRGEMIRDLSLAISTGERVLVCGPSGAGKTTVLALVLGLVRPQAGWVLVGDVPAFQRSPSDVGERPAWLPQHPHLFHGTIASNVRLGAPGASDAEVQRALMDVGAAFVDGLLDGIQTRVGDRGVTLSGGQRQRVALARTLLVDAPLMLLDEPLAHLDAEARRAASLTIEARTRGRTVLVAVHSPEFFPWADRVLTLDTQPQTVSAHTALERASV